MQDARSEARYLPESERARYLSLKEAAERTGYTADYIGQLIRAGKLEGFQVYSTVSWVTTEDALRTYLEVRGKSELVEEERTTIWGVEERYVRRMLYVLIGLLGMFFALLCYVGIVRIDRSIGVSTLEEFDASAVYE